MAEGDLPGAFASEERPILLLVGDTDPEISQSPGPVHSCPATSTELQAGMVVFAKTGHGVFRDSNVSQYRQSMSAFRSAVVRLANASAAAMTGEIEI